MTARSLASVVGFGTAALVIDLGGYTAAFLLNASSFVVSASALAFVRWPKSRQTPVSPGRRGSKSLWWYLPPLIAGMVVVRGVDALASAGHNVALPIYASLTAADHPAAVSTQFMTAWAIGSMSAHQLVSRFVRRLDHRTFAIATCAMSVCFVLAFTGLPAFWLVVACLLAGVADGVSEIGYLSTLQTRSERERTRVFGLVLIGLFLVNVVAPLIRVSRSAAHLTHR